MVSGQNKHFIETRSGRTPADRQQNPSKPQISNASDKFDSQRGRIQRHSEVVDPSNRNIDPYLQPSGQAPPTLNPYRQYGDVAT